MMTDAVIKTEIKSLRNSFTEEIVIAFEVVEEGLVQDELHRALDFGNADDLDELAYACELDETLEPLFAGATRRDQWLLIIALKDAAMVREQEQLGQLVNSFTSRGGFRGLAGG